MHVDASKRCELNLVRLSNIKNYEKICLTNFDLFNFMHFYTRTRRPLSDGTLQRMMLAFFLLECNSPARKAVRFGCNLMFDFQVNKLLM